MYFAPLSTRNLFGKLLNDRKLLGEAVEIGTHRGDFARVLLTDWKGEKLYCVDPYDKAPPEYADQIQYLQHSDGNRVQDEMVAHNTLQWAADRICWLKETSAEASRRGFEPLDFVYLDGDHKKIAEDLELWWPKLGEGGILGGHDWLLHNEPGGLWGKYIQPAVHAFAEKAGRDIHLVVEEGGHPWSFYLVK